MGAGVRGWILRDVALVVLVFGATLALGIWIGHGVARINALAAQPTAQVRVATKAEAWECVARAQGWRPRRRIEDLRVPGR